MLVLILYLIALILFGIATMCFSFFVVMFIPEFKKKCKELKGDTKNEDKKRRRNNG